MKYAIRKSAKCSDCINTSPVGHIFSDRYEDINAAFRRVESKNKGYKYDGCTKCACEVIEIE